ncbi:MAG: hypothetical protein L0K86_08195 [Actinomycetia bacterium]|nr:hypothetical protein [Actinomycetes bacterium]
MGGTHVTAFFKAPDNVDVVKSGSAIMNALLDAEHNDPAVTDGTVSVDANMRIVEVEAYAPGLMKAQGEPLIVDRIDQVMRETVGLTDERTDRRVVEYA